MPTVLGYPIVDDDGDGQYEARDPNTWEVKGTYTPPADTTDDGDAEDNAQPAPADPDADDPAGDEDGKDSDSMPNPMDDGTAVVIDPNRPPIQIVIGGGDPVGPDDEGRPSRNATGPLIRGRNKGDIDPLPDTIDRTVAIDTSRPPIQIVIGGGDPIGPDDEGRPSRNATGPLIRGRNKGDIDPLPDTIDRTVAIDTSRPPIQIVIGGGDPIDPDVDGGAGGGPGRPGSDEAVGPLGPHGIDPKARRDRPPL